MQAVAIVACVMFVVLCSLAYRHASTSRRPDVGTDFRPTHRFVDYDFSHAFATGFMQHKIALKTDDFSM